MPRINISLYGRDYQLACEPGQERRVAQLAALVEEKMRAVAAHAGNTTEPRLFMLACMMMADELLDLRDAKHGMRLEEEDELMTAIAQMQERVGTLVSAAGRA
ncbi:MAG: cell division protein ZapA [Alphaproteobacteria bacterium]